MAAGLDTLLKKLFSNRVGIFRRGDGSYSAVDFNRLQSLGSVSMQSPRGLSGRKTAWKSSLASGRGQFFGGNFHDTYGGGAGSQQRNSLYADYEVMDTDAIISAALDIYADECTVRGENDELINIDTEKTKVKKLLHSLFYDVLNIETNLWSWVRNLCKLGDYVLLMDVARGHGVVNVTPIHPSYMMREEDEDGNIVFKYMGEGMGLIDRVEFDAYEVAHFRMYTDPSFLPHGKSILEGGRKAYKQLIMVEDAMLLHRIMRAPQKRVFYVDVGNMSPDEVPGYVEDFATTMKKVPYYDEDTGEYNLRYNLINMMEDLYVPRRGQDSGAEVDTLDGLSNEHYIEDVEYYKHKLLSFLKIPKSYLGYDEEVEGKSVLAAEDMRFARTVERIQSMVVGELYKIAVVHLICNGVTDLDDLQSFKLSLNSPSLIYERQKVELMSEKVNLIQTMEDLNLRSRRWMYENLFHLSPDEWKHEEDEIIEDLKKRFRRQQIVEEGNDPKVSGESFGTPHDLASMHAASVEADMRNADKVNRDVIKRLYKHDLRHNNPGRPKSGKYFATDKDQDFGRDPTGGKTFTSISNMEHMTPEMLDLLKDLRTSKSNAVEKLLKEDSGDTIDMLEDNGDSLKDLLNEFNFEE